VKHHGESAAHCLPDLLRVDEEFGRGGNHEPLGRRIADRLLEFSTAGIQRVTEYRRVCRDNDTIRRQVLEDRHQIGAQVGKEGDLLLERKPAFDLFEQPEDPLAGQFELMRPLLDLFPGRPASLPFPFRRNHHRLADPGLGDSLDRALRLGVECAYRLDRVPEKIDAQGLRLGERVDVDQASAHGVVAGSFHNRRRRVAKTHQERYEPVSVLRITLLYAIDVPANEFGRDYPLEKGREGSDHHDRGSGLREGKKALEALHGGLCVQAAADNGAKKCARQRKDVSLSGAVASGVGQGEPRTEEFELLEPEIAVRLAGHDTENRSAIVLCEEGCDQGTCRARGPADVDLATVAGKGGQKPSNVVHHP
jgi:hypothetical protein